MYGSTLFCQLAAYLGDPGPRLPRRVVHCQPFIWLRAVRSVGFGRVGQPFGVVGGGRGGASLREGIYSVSYLARKSSFGDQEFAEHHRIRMVDREAPHGRSPCRGIADEKWPIPVKMITSRIASRVEQRDGTAGLRIDARKVRPLMGIASKAT